MKQAKSDLGARIHRAFMEMAFTQQQIVHVEGLKKIEQERLENGQMDDAEYEKIQARFEVQSRQLFSRLEQKSREIDHLKRQIREADLAEKV